MKKNKGIFKVIPLFLALTMTISLASACSGSSAKTDAPTAANAESTQAGTEKAAATAAATEAVTQTAAASEEAAPPEDGPLTPFTEPCTINLMMEDNPNQKFIEGESISNNAIINFFKEHLNINYVTEWLVDTTKYADQLNMAISSNSLPDMFVANAEQVANLARNGQIEDYTDIYEKYASPLLRDTIEFHDKIAFGPATIDNRLYAIPLTNDFSDEITVMYIRDDWMQKLGLQPPKTMDDLFAIAEAFSKNDPDGNGQNDTYGIATDMYLNYIFEMVGPYYGGYRGIWLKDNSGKLAYSNTMPAFKESLREINKMFHAGLTDPEFAVKDIFAMTDGIAQGKYGIYPGSFWALYWMLGLNMDNQPDSNWKAYPLLSSDSSPVKPRALDTTHRWLVMRKGFEHPEAAVKQANLWMEMWQGEYASWYWGLQATGSPYSEAGIDLKTYSPVFIDPPYKNIQKANAVAAAIASGDPSALNAEQKNHYDAAVAEVTDSTEKSVKVSKYKANMDIQVFKIIGDIYGNNLVYSEFNGPNSKLMSEKWPLANQVTDQMLPQIVMGDDVDAAFDNYVKEWLNAGGDVITSEVNAWYQQKQ